MSENLFCFFPPKMGFSGHFDSIHWDLGLGLGQVTQPFGSKDPDPDRLGTDVCMSVQIPKYISSSS
jgi:hypothetical protein